MALPCSWCGSLLTQAGADKHQCLACGELTNADGSRSVHMVSTTAYVAAASGDVQETDRRYRPGDVIPGAPETTPATAVAATETADQQDVTPAAVPPPVVAEPVEPAPIDLASLSPEQVAAIELIAHSEQEQ